MAYKMDHADSGVFSKPKHILQSNHKSRIGWVPSTEYSTSFAWCTELYSQTTFEVPVSQSGHDRSVPRYTGRPGPSRRRLPRWGIRRRDVDPAHGRTGGSGPADPPSPAPRSLSRSSGSESQESQEQLWRSVNAAVRAEGLAVGKAVVRHVDARRVVRR